MTKKDVCIWADKDVCDCFCEGKNMTRENYSSDVDVPEDWKKEDWILSEYNENTEEQLDYYLNYKKHEKGDKAYLYYHADKEFVEMEIVHIINRSDDIPNYDAICASCNNILLDGECKYSADTSAEFIWGEDSCLVWFKYIEKEDKEAEYIQEMASNLMEDIDEVLEKYDLNLVTNEDKEDFETSKTEEGNTATIYGSVYYDIEDVVKNTLRKMMKRKKA